MSQESRCSAINRKKFYEKECPQQKGGETPERGKLFAGWIGSGKTVLDIGCGDGAGSSDWVTNGNKVFGIEIAEAPAGKALSRGIDVTVADVEHGIPFLKETLDVVVAGEVIEHWYDTDAFLREINRVLRYGGELMLSTPNIASLGRRLMLLIGRNPFCEFSVEEKVGGLNPVGHIRYFTQRDILHMLRKHGFGIEAVTSDGFNCGLFQSVALARMFPSLAWRHILKAAKER